MAAVYAYWSLVYVSLRQSGLCPFTNCVRSKMSGIHLLGHFYLKHGGKVNRSTGTNTLGILTSLETRSYPTHRVLKANLLWPQHWFQCLWLSSSPLLNPPPYLPIELISLSQWNSNCIYQTKTNNPNLTLFAFFFLFGFGLVVWKLCL